MSFLFLILNTCFNSILRDSYFYQKAGFFEIKDSPKKFKDHICMLLPKPTVNLGLQSTLTLAAPISSSGWRKRSDKCFEYKNG